MINANWEKSGQGQKRKRGPTLVIRLEMKTSKILDALQLQQGWSDGVGNQDEDDEMDLDEGYLEEAFANMEAEARQALSATEQKQEKTVSLELSWMLGPSK